MARFMVCSEGQGQEDNKFPRVDLRLSTRNIVTLLFSAPHPSTLAKQQLWDGNDPFTPQQGLWLASFFTVPWSAKQLRVSNRLRLQQYLSSNTSARTRTNHKHPRTNHLKFATYVRCANTNGRSKNQTELPDYADAYTRAFYVLLCVS
jgi:hypothetical protein